MANPRKAFEGALAVRQAQDDVTDKIKQFFLDNPDPSDKQVHDFAGKLGIDEHKFEEAIYKLLSGYVKGVGKHVDTPDSEFDAKELAMGIEVEKEHVDDPAIRKEIAKDHLAELKDYYTRLKKMEGEGDGDKTASSNPRRAFEEAITKTSSTQERDLVSRLDSLIRFMGGRQFSLRGHLEFTEEQLSEIISGLKGIQKSLARLESLLSSHSRTLDLYEGDLTDVPPSMNDHDWKNLYSDLVALRKLLRD